MLLSRPNQSGSFTLRASTYTGANPSIPISDPELLVDGKYITEILNLRGTYRFKFKNFLMQYSTPWTTASAPAPFAGENIIPPIAWFISPQISSYATKTNYMSIGTQQTNSSSGFNLGDGMYIDMIATVNGCIEWNMVISNPWYGNTEPYPSISPWLPYAAGMTPNPTTQPFWTSVPRFVNVSVNIDWEYIGQ